jgi:hypothetical protein
MGRFTLRDEGKTIAVGKVLKYVPYVKGVVGNTKTNVEGVSKQLAQTSISSAGGASSGVKEMVYDMETGEMKEKAPALGGIAEGNENEDDD